MKGYLSFEVPDMSKSLPKIMNKIQELQAQHNTSMDLSPLQTLATTLTATSRYHSSTVDQAPLLVLQQLLTTLPLTAIFPVLDLARVTALHPDAVSDKHETPWRDLISQGLIRCTQVTSLKEDKSVAAVPMLMLRMVTNAIKGRGGRRAVWTHLEGVLSCVEKFVKMTGGNKNLRLTVSTVLLNIASGLHNQEGVPPSLLWDVLGHVLSSQPAYETEALTRALVALGTILLLESSSLTSANKTKVKTLLDSNGLDMTTLSEKGRAVVEEIRSLV